ncbi:hypothetical protein [Salinibacterium sp.]|uniref:hypothetical protein n=1 Tax=Salinibacterium sp. TaxID=1915057 RepID=UPI00286AD1A5|nr:hypothetical protein [Salinibacterium sp.]
MNSLTTNRTLVAFITASLLLAGCAQVAPATEEGSAGSGSGSGSETLSTDCSIYEGQTDPELTLFTSNAVAAGPGNGQVFGDGTELSVTLSQEAIDAGLLPQFELITLSETGGPVVISSLAFDPTTGGDGTYSTSTLEFGNDELVGTAMIAEIFAISDATVGDTQPYGDKLLLGNYCMTYANDGS